MRKLTAGLMALVLVGCGASEGPAETWPGDVRQEVDDLTGEPLGVFISPGPAVVLEVDSVTADTVRLSYVCVRGGWDALLLGDPPASDAENVLEDHRRMVVDGKLYDWPVKRFQEGLAGQWIEQEKKMIEDAVLARVEEIVEMREAATREADRHRRGWTTPRA